MRESRAVRLSKYQESPDYLKQVKLKGDISEVISEIEVNDNWKSPERKRKKLDVMTPTAVTSDRLNLSYRQRAMFAASVANASGMGVNETNISVSSAYRAARKRVACSKTLKDMFDAPDAGLIHWDGKILKQRRGISSERCCVYLSGVNFGVDQEGDMKTLLGVPEIPDGTGKSQEQAVIKLLID